MKTLIALAAISLAPAMAQNRPVKMNTVILHVVKIPATLNDPKIPQTQGGMWFQLQDEDQNVSGWRVTVHFKSPLNPNASMQFSVQRKFWDIAQGWNDAVFWTGVLDITDVSVEEIKAQPATVFPGFLFDGSTIQ